MKRLSLIAVFVWLMGITTFACSQFVATPAAVYIPGQSVTKAQICARLNHQVAKVNSDSKVGKITTDQANQFLALLQSIKAQIKADYAQNGKKELTNDQKASLSSMLDQTGSNIHAVSGIKDYTGK